jgi:hypothetical protein
MEAEYKTWLDLDDGNHQATLARAMIALANHGGGVVVIGFESVENGVLRVRDDLSPADPRQVYARERVQRILNKYAEPSFEIAVDFVARPGGGVLHPIIEVRPTGLDPVVAARGSPDNKTLLKGACYIRRPGPESAAPRTFQDWRQFIDTYAARRRVAEALPSDPRNTNATAPRGESERGRRTVRDRMSQVAAPPRSPAETDITQYLDADERHVLESPVSQARVDGLKSAIRDRLERTMPTFVLFEKVGTRIWASTYLSDLRFGNGLVSFKGPFVDNSSWVEVRDWEFAVALERFLLRQFAELLVERSQDAVAIPRTLEAIRAFARESSTAIGQRGGHPDLLVLLQPESHNEIEELLVHDPQLWGAAQEFRGAPLANVTFVLGQVEGLPLLVLNDSLVDDPMLCVADLEDFELFLSRAAEHSDDYLDISITPISQEDAVRRVAADPHLRERLYRNKYDSDGSVSFDEAVVRMQLMAEYRFTAAGEVRERHIPRTEFAKPSRRDS